MAVPKIPRHLAPPCACGCARPATTGRRSGYAEACHQRWLAAGRPAEGPPPGKMGRPRGPGRRRGEPSAEAARRAAQAPLTREEFISEYDWIHAERIPAPEAARRIGVSVRTVLEYRRELAGGTPAPEQDEGEVAA